MVSYSRRVRCLLKGTVGLCKEVKLQQLSLKYDQLLIFYSLFVHYQLQFMHEKQLRGIHYGK